jgi:hypothetical protein
VGAEARARRGRLLEAQEEAEREAKQEAAAEAARLAAAERAQEVAAREAARVAAAAKAREEAVATAKADALERATAEGGGSGAAGPSGASVATVPDDYICPITAEIMTDPVSTLDGFTYERAAITEWLRTKDTSPKTGATLESKALIPNLMARSVIRSFTEAAAAAAAQPLPAVSPSTRGSGISGRAGRGRRGGRGGRGGRREVRGI